MIAAATAADVADVRGLFEAYAASLEIDLGYQGFAAELAGLPGSYAPPAGALLLARDAAGPALGCVALRPLADAGVCEMKRLYVAPAARGLGLGAALVAAILAEARRIGYREIRLDTLPTMASAIALYRRAGFAEIGALLRHAGRGHPVLRLRARMRRGLCRGAGRAVQGGQVVAALAGLRAAGGPALTRGADVAAAAAALRGADLVARLPVLASSSLARAQ